MLSKRCHEAFLSLKNPVFMRTFSVFGIIPTFFVVLLWLIYTLNIILNGNFDTDFPPIISFIKIFVAEKVAKSPAELCQVVVMQLLVITGMRLSSADLTAAIDTASEECQQRCDDNVDQRNDLI